MNKQYDVIILGADNAGFAAVSAAQQATTFAFSTFSSGAKNLL